MSTETLRPNAAGDETYISSSTGIHWQDVDEVTPDEDSTFVYTISPDWQRDLYNIANHSIGSGTINFIRVYARAKAIRTPDQTSLKIAIKAGQGTGAPDTVSESSEITLIANYANYSNQWSTNPKTAAAFTWDEIDNLQIGIVLRRSVTTGEYCCCTQVYVEVDYTAAQTITLTAAISAASSVQAPTMSQVKIAGLVTLLGNPVEGATTRAVNQDTDAVEVEATDVNGVYKFWDLPVGTYHVVVEYETGGVKYNAKSLWDIEVP